jgi:ketosteroid isomerase-like protein
MHVTIRSMFWGSLALLVAMSAAAAQAASADSSEQAVTAAEQQWLKSQQTNNTDLLAPLLADKVVETTEGSKLVSGKEAVVADAKTDKWSSAEYSDLKVTVFGTHTAIATGIFTGKRADTAGHPAEVRVRFTDTWVKMPNGKWLCVASHDSPLKM